MSRILPTLLAMVAAAIVYFARWVIRTAAGAPGMTAQRPTRKSPGSQSPRDRARLAEYSKRRSNRSHTSEGNGMDSIARSRISAHARSADAHSRSAEFHSALAETFEALGDQTQANTARELADYHRRNAKRESALAG